MPRAEQAAHPRVPVSVSRLAAARAAERDYQKNTYYAVHALPSHFAMGYPVLSPGVKRAKLKGFCTLARRAPEGRAHRTPAQGRFDRPFQTQHHVAPNFSPPRHGRPGALSACRGLEIS